LLLFHILLSILLYIIDLPKGTVVGYAPLVHVAMRGEQIFEVIYNGESKHGMERSEHRDEEEIDAETEEEEMNSENRFTKPDLVINYSFGHRNSTLHLTPYGAMVNYINHKSANDGDGPNVRVQWPTKELVAYKPDWLSKDIEFLRDSVGKIGLSFDYVALRDIKEGEEVTMDYGDEWVSNTFPVITFCPSPMDFLVLMPLIGTFLVLLPLPNIFSFLFCIYAITKDNAWKEHVANWVPPEDSEGYVHSSNFEADYLRTPDELEKEPYPWNLHTICTNYYSKDSTDSYIYESSLVNNENKYRLPCQVLERVEEDDKEEEESYVYTVEIKLSDTETIFARGYPNDEHGVDLYDKAYSQMWHMQQAFRNKMYIPDDIFPENWITKEQ
jgi:hypothetical protein